MAVPMHVAAALLLTGVIFAGCVAGEDDEPGTESGFHARWSELPLRFGADHDHTDPAQHLDATTPNFDVLGFTPIHSEHYGGVAGGYLCGDAQATEDGRHLAVVESRSDVGFAILDVTDPVNPILLGELIMAYTYIYDVAVVLDGRHVALVTAGTDNLPETPITAIAAGPAAAMQGDATRGAGRGSGTVDGAPPAGLYWRGPCTDGRLVPVARTPAAGNVADQSPEDPVPRPMDLVLVDITDPAQPTIVDDQPIYGHGHSVFPTTLDGRHMLLVTTARPDLDPVYFTGYFLYEVVETPLGGKVRLVSTFWPPGGGPLPMMGGPRGHDGWISEHPVTGQMIGFLAGASRFTTVDYSDPAEPVELGRWEPPVADYFAHSTFPLPELWDGRHYTLLGPEYCRHPAETPTGVFWVIDTTDPTDPFPVAGWTLPHEVEWDDDGCYLWSNHYFTAVGQTAFMSLYHGGIWAIDLSPLATRPDAFVQLDSVGAFVPADPSLPDAADPVRWAPTFEEVLAMPDGSLVTFDGNYGLYTLRFDEGRPAPAPEPWAIEEP